MQSPLTADNAAYAQWALQFLAKLRIRPHVRVNECVHIAGIFKLLRGIWINFILIKFP